MAVLFVEVAAHAADGVCCVQPSCMHLAAHSFLPIPQRAAPLPVFLELTVLTHVVASAHACAAGCAACASEWHQQPCNQQAANTWLQQASQRCTATSASSSSNNNSSSSSSCSYSASCCGAWRDQFSAFACVCGGGSGKGGSSCCRELSSGLQGLLQLCSCMHRGCANFYLCMFGVLLWWSLHSYMLTRHRPAHGIKSLPHEPH
jgi:hypothetical protein